LNPHDVNFYRLVHTKPFVALNVAFTCELWNWTVKLVDDWWDVELKLYFFIKNVFS